MDIAKLYENKKPMEVFAFYGPCDGKLDNGKPMGDGTDFRIKERYIEYKECGFDILLIEDEAVYNGEPFMTSKTKEVMDICYEIGLKVIVLDRRIYYLAIKGFKGKEIDGFTINSTEDLHKLVAFYMKDYMHHPAFMGVYIMDEPIVEQLDDVSAIVGAIKAAKSDCYVHICHTSAGAIHSRNDELVKRDNWSDITWDQYLFMYYETMKNPKLCRTFHLYMEKIKKFSQKHNIGFTAVTLQAFGGDLLNGCTGLGWRQVDDYDLRYQVYASLLYYPTRLCWFHYWASKHNINGNTEKSIMNAFGEKVMYDQAQKLNAEIKALSKVMNNFDYRGVNVFNDKKTSTYYFLNEIDFKFNDMTVEKIKGAVIISEGYDKENNLTGFLVHNSIEPEKRKSATLTLNFKGADKVVIFDRAKPKTVVLKDGKLKLKLPCAEGVFIIPQKVN